MAASDVTRTREMGVAPGGSRECSCGRSSRNSHPATLAIRPLTWRLATGGRKSNAALEHDLHALGKWQRELLRAAGCPKWAPRATGWLGAPLADTQALGWSGHSSYTRARGALVVSAGASRPPAQETPSQHQNVCPVPGGRSAQAGVSLTRPFYSCAISRLRPSSLGSGRDRLRGFASRRSPRSLAIGH
jgi:hypothetical protein